LRIVGRVAHNNGRDVSPAEDFVDGGYDRLRVHFYGFSVRFGRFFVRKKSDREFTDANRSFRTQAGV